MSDVEKWLKTAGSKPNKRPPPIAKVEAAERAEGLRDALKAGRGNVVAGAHKLHMAKEGLPAQLKKAKTGPKKRGGK